MRHEFTLKLVLRVAFPLLLAVAFGLTLMAVRDEGSATLALALVVALFGLSGYLLVLTRRMTRKIEALRSQRDHLLIEERRVFEFLHELGEAFVGDLRPSELYRRIVDGAVRILEAHGGVLYLLDRTGAQLTPVSISKGCPPLLEIPAHVREQAMLVPNAAESYVRLHNLKPGEGLIGSVWQEGKALLLSAAEGESRLEALRSSGLRTDSAILAPLLYAGQNLGVLGVANGPMGATFTEADFVVFKAIAEQSAFALFTATMFAEAHEKRRLDHDLQVARDIQRILLPSGSPKLPGFEICGINLPARSVSGDYFDYLRVDDERLGVAIADVSGKGIPASLIMTMCRSVLRSASTGQPSPAEVLRTVNRQLFNDIKEDMFVSAAYLIMKPNQGEMTLARAGHDAPLLYVAREGVVNSIKPPGMALGIDSGGVFDRVIKDQSITLEKGDCLVLYTDGVSEALDPEGMELGLENVMLAIRESAPNGPGAVLQRLTDDLRTFAGTQPQHDDITLIAISKT